MAALVLGLNAIKVHDDGDSERIVLYAMRNITAADTIDLSGDFNPPLRAALVGTTLAGAVLVSTFAGNVLTIPAGPNKDAAYMLVYGVHA
jgi:hypothetical protein